MLSNWYPAPNVLTGILAGIWSVHSPADRDLLARVLPDGTTYLVFQRDGTVLRSSDDHGRPWLAACVSGPRTEAFDIQLSSAGRILIVQLGSAGASQALGVPMSELTDNLEDLSSVIELDHRFQHLNELICGEADDESCVRVIEEWLLPRAQFNSNVCMATKSVVDLVKNSCGKVRVEDLARQVDLSRRHLGRVVRQRVGFSPKLFARIIRFDHAVQLGRVRPVLPLSQIALAAGYADQAHMTREFADLGGIRPSDLRGEAGAMIW